jgi:hypothetical protein
MKHRFLRKLPAVLLAGYLASPAAALAAFHFFDPTDTAAVPKLLSQTGLYADIAGKVPDTALKYFDINAPLWSDGAAKQRWILLPPGKHIVYDDTTDMFSYPDSTVFVKTFLLDAVEGDSTTRRYQETRLLVHRKNGAEAGTWHGFSYRWNATATDARLVSLENGFDTVFQGYRKGPSQAQGYKRWRYPARADCNRCHVQREGGALVPRTILGFLPPQLKRAAPLQPSTPQIAWLFSQGVFVGTLPGPQQLARRWKNIREEIPPNLTLEERFRVIDTLARSYIAANCSGCHSRRGMPGSGAPEHVDYDYYDLKPRIEMGLLEATQTQDLDVEDTVTGELKGRLYYLDALRQAGLSTAPGAVWDMARPSGRPAVVYPGFPSYSTLLFRQWKRQTPARDSADVRQIIASGGNIQAWGSWIFTQPWGSPAWFDLVRQHGVDPMYALNPGGITEVNGAMPPVMASFIPDVEAMKILGEWVKTYRTLYVVDSTRIITRVGKREIASTGSLRIRGGLVILPEGSKDRPELVSPAGRRYALQPAGKGRFALPARLTPGVYFVHAGKLFLRVPVLD